MPHLHPLGQVLHALILARPFADQTFAPPDALQRAMIGRRVEPASDSTRPEGGQLPAWGHDLLLDLRGGLARLVL